MAYASTRHHQRTSRSRARALPYLVSFCLAWLVPTGAIGGADTKEGPIQAAFVYNFCKFVEWPADENSELVLGLMGAPESTSHFESIAGKTAREQVITVKQIKNPSNLDACQLVFIAPDQAKKIPDILEQLEGRPVLTISDMEGFCELGGMIQFVSIQGKMRFYINRRAAEHAQLTISSQLLKMAKIVEGGAQE